MRSGERLPTLTADQKKQFGPFVWITRILYGYSQQANQAMDSGRAWLYTALTQFAYRRITLRKAVRCVK